VFSSNLFKAVPAVCRRWHHLCRSPPLLQSLLIEVETRSLLANGPLVRLRSLCSFLAHAAQRVRFLSLKVHNVQEEEAAEAEALVASIVTMCGVAGSLQHLRLSTDFAMHYSSWMSASLGKLRDRKSVV